MRSATPAVGFVAALAAEARCLRGLSRRAGAEARRSSLVILRCCGVGGARAERAARALVDEGAGALVSWGTAAALRPDLAPGAVALPRRVHGAHDAPVEVDAEWHERVRRRLEGRVPCTVGDLAEARAVLRTAQDKRDLRAATGAEVADMESAAVAMVARRAGLPFLTIRAICDGASQGVPGAALAALGEEGGLRLGPLLAALACSPAETPALVRLAVGFGRARRSLARVVRLAGAELAAVPASRSGPA